ncbi:AT-hook motif nuclear-localized protein 1-like [Solanum tuberosum]|uniref:AT-hook motif nuclear-localized protein 1-like n=1 Tax=Solanum tuberosum TaxID=4113 RepID=UPI00073A18E8|nr:PREDICTED: AT-hook motif nuclear-localized protein 1-like [Solanum tuberosum]
MAASDASSDYRMTGSAQPAVATQSGAASAVTTQKKKRGRPRNNGPNGSVDTPISAEPISSAAPSQVIDFSSKKKQAKVRPVGDVSMKVLSFFQQGSRSMCILSATGVISSVTFHQTDTSGGKVAFEGRYDLLTFAGSFVHSETGGMRNLSGGMSVSLISPEGRVIGGRIDGQLVAASPVQEALCS